MDGTLHDRDFYTWTREQAAALRRLAATRANLDAEWRAARRIAAGKLGHHLTHLPTPCPFTLDELLDEDLPLDTLLARLPGP